MEHESKTRIVILGGGYAGIETAKKLAKHYRKNPAIDITLIDRNPWHTLMTELHEIAGSRTEPEAVQISFQRIFAGSKVHIITDKIDSIDFDGKKLVSASDSYKYDYLVLGTGGKPDFFGLPGIQEHSFTLWSLEDAIAIREHVEEQFRKSVKEHSAEKRSKLLSFVVAGAGFTGIEFVGELVEHADTLCRKYHIHRDEVKISVVEAMGDILPILSEKPRQKARRYLERKGVEILLNAPIVEAQEGSYILKDGRRLEAATFVWTCGVQASELTAKLPLSKGKTARDTGTVVAYEGIHGRAGARCDDPVVPLEGERGRINVDSHLESTDRPGVYLCGDVIWHLHEGKPVPQIVENALQSGETVAKNIIADIDKKEKHDYSPSFHGFMISIGSRYAVASVMGMNLYSIFAMGMKHLINLHYLWNLAGVNACWSYMLEEFIDVKQKRSMLHGHLSARIPAFFALPARLWLGLVWVMEGVNKIGEGWLHFDKSRSWWMFSKGVSQAGTGSSAVASGVQLLGDGASGAADAVSAASESWDGVEAAAEAAGDVVMNITVGGAAQRTFGKIWDLDKTIFSMDSVLVTWFRETFMDGIAAHLHFGLFQTSIVLVEIALGLALMGGLFTFPAAAVSIIMCFVFILSGMFSWSQLWFIFLAVLLLGGGGKAFGLDHYVLPWIRDRWSGTRLAQRSHLFAGEPLMTRTAKKKKNR